MKLHRLKNQRQKYKNIYKYNILKKDVRNFYIYIHKVFKNKNEIDTSVLTDILEAYKEALKPKASDTFYPCDSKYFAKTKGDFSHPMRHVLSNSRPKTNYFYLWENFTKYKNTQIQQKPKSRKNPITEMMKDFEKELRILQFDFYLNTTLSENDRRLLVKEGYAKKLKLGKKHLPTPSKPIDLATATINALQILLNQCLTSNYNQSKFSIHDSGSHRYPIVLPDAQRQSSVYLLDLLILKTYLKENTANKQLQSKIDKTIFFSAELKISEREIKQWDEARSWLRTQKSKNAYKLLEVIRRESIILIGRDRNLSILKGCFDKGGSLKISTDAQLDWFDYISSRTY